MLWITLMCAIVAILHFDGNSERVDREELRRVRDRMTSRGPDGAGEWYSADGKMGLGHRRLSIIDLSNAASQPMCAERTGSRLSGISSQLPGVSSQLSAKGSREYPSPLPSPLAGRGETSCSHVITFNGEIYNYRELRAQLEGRGYRFKSSSDTEVLLHMYAEHGESMVDHLRGMYAFAIWNDQRRELFLARDPFGIKPLYFYKDERRFCLASQVKALQTLKAMDRTSDPAGHVGFLLWGHVPEPYTLHKCVRSLPAGATMTIKPDGSVSLNQRCRIRDVLLEADRSPLDLQNQHLHVRLRKELFDTVKQHLIADVPTGVFLSAGLDSNMIAVLAAQTEAQLRTVTIGFEEYRGTAADETSLAEATAKQIGSLHKTIWIGRDDFARNYGHLMEAMDLPTTDGVNSFFISQAAVEAGLKVALSGLGGDELFGSYPSFKEIPLAVQNLRLPAHVPALGRSFRRIAAPLCKRFTSPKYAGLIEYGGTYGGAYLLRRGMFMPWELPDLVGPDVAREGWEKLRPLIQLEDQCCAIQSPHLKVAALEMENYMRNQLLRDTDWASMAFSLEIRTPLVDLPLVRALAPLFGGKAMLRKSDVAKVALNGLSQELLCRRKTGFTVPMRDWLHLSKKGKGPSRGLRSWAYEVYGEFRGV